MRLPPLIAIGAICAACSPSGEDRPDLGEIGSISMNSLAPAALLDNGPALSALGAGALANATTALVDSEMGQKLLKYVARCALPEGDAVSFPLSGGGELEEPGLLGFAPEWKQGALDETAQRVMTGCLMAHVNAFQIQVPISVRTAGKGEASPEEQQLFPAQEMSAFGNYFDADPAQRFLHICFGEGVARALGFEGGVGGGRPAYLDLRVCSTQDACGFNRVGACFAWPQVLGIDKTACSDASGSFYSGCHERPIQLDPATQTWDETVTVYLQEEHLAQLVEEYRQEACAVSTLRCSGGAICAPSPICDSVEL